MFTAFKAKLASCEANSIKAEAFKAQAADKISALCGTNKVSSKASSRGGTNFKAFYKAKEASGNVKLTSSEVKANDVGEDNPVMSRTEASTSGEACLALSRAKAQASGETSLASGAKIPTL